MLITLTYLRVKGQSEVQLIKTVLIEGPFHADEIISYFYVNSEIHINQLRFNFHNELCQPSFFSVASFTLPMYFFILS